MRRAFRLTLLDSIPDWGGGEAWCVRTAALLGERGHSVRVACQAGSELEVRARAAGLEVWCGPLTGAAALVSAARLGRSLHEERTDLLIANTGRDVRLGALACARGGVRLVQRRGIARPLKRDPLTKRLYTRDIAAVVANCDAIRAAMLKGAPWADPERFRVIPNDVTPAAHTDPAARAAARRALRVEQDAPLVVVVGRLAPMKGHADLLRAWPAVLAGLPNARLAVIGDGALSESLASRAGEAALRGSVTLHGARPDVRDLLAGADLFVQPSVRDEGCSNALLEAMAAGLPAVVTACGGLPETVVEGATGRVVPIGDPERLAAALRELLADAPLRARFGAAARARALEHYSPDAVAASWEALFAELSP